MHTRKRKELNEFHNRKLQFELFVSIKSYLFLLWRIVLSHLAFSIDAENGLIYAKSILLFHDIFSTFELPIHYIYYAIVMRASNLFYRHRENRRLIERCKWKSFGQRKEYVSKQDRLRIFTTTTVAECRLYWSHK